MYAPFVRTPYVNVPLPTYHCQRGEGEEDGLRVGPLVGGLLVRPVDAAAAQVEPHLGGDGHHLLVLDEALVDDYCQLFVYLQLFVYFST